MKYIKDTDTLNKIQRLASGGDKRAKEFLYNFQDLEEEKINQYLEEVKSGNNVDSVLSFLIQDEVEAIDGYVKGLERINNCINLTEEKKKELNEKLEYIIKDEKEHIDILKELLNDRD